MKGPEGSQKPQNSTSFWAKTAEPHLFGIFSQKKYVKMKIEQNRAKTAQKLPKNPESANDVSQNRKTANRWTHPYLESRSTLTNCLS